MAAIDFRRLERDSYGEAREATAGLRMTPEVLGQIVMLTIQIYGEGRGSMTRRKLEELFLRSDVPLPKSIADILHVEPRIDGARLEEVTRMTVAPQASGMAGRLNPDNVSLLPKTDLLQSFAMLNRYGVDFPEEIRWLKQRIKGLADNV